MAAAQVLMQHLSSLQADNLYSSVEILGGFLLTSMKNSSDYFTAANHYEILLCHADAKFEKRQHRSAEFKYREALTIRKNGLKQKGGAAEFSKLRSDIEVKYRIHECCMAIGNTESAAAILESILGRQKTSKIYYALARCYHKSGCHRPAIACYKEVLKRSPLALDVIFELLALGEPVDFIFSLMSNNAQIIDWLMPLLKAYALMYKKEYSKSISLYSAIEKKTALLGDARLQSFMAHLKVMSGHNKEAMSHFALARSMNTFMLDGMELYAYLLFEQNDFEKLDKLARDLFSQCDQHPASWVALGYRALAKGDYKRAVYLAVQATDLDRLCAQGLVLKGCALRAIDEVKDAIVHFREALRLDPNRFVCYKELVDTYIPREQINEAVAVAHSALKTIGSQPNCLVLCASVHMMESNGKDKAMNYVNKALSQEPNHECGIIVKGEILHKNGKFNEAIKFLSNCVQNHSSSRMHTLLGKCHHEVKNLSKAADHYTIALSLDPDKKEAADGLAKISQMQEDAYFAENDDSGHRGHDPEDGNSDSDVMYTE